MTKKIKISIWLMLLFISTLSTLKAQSCDALLKDLMEYAKGGGYVTYQISGLGGSNYWGQYAEGVVNYSTTTNPRRPPSEFLTGESLQYFSDRVDRIANPNPGGGFGSETIYWFSKNLPDKLSFSVKKGGILLTNGVCATPVTLTLLTWGNAKSTYCPVCKGDFMYLLDNGMVIRFRKTTNPNPR